MIGDSVDEQLKRWADSGDEIAIQKLSSCIKCGVQFSEMKDKRTFCDPCKRSEAEDEMPEYVPADSKPMFVEGGYYCILCLETTVPRPVCATPGCIKGPPKVVLESTPNEKPNWFTEHMKHDGTIIGVDHADAVDAFAMSMYRQAEAVKYDHDKVSGYHLIPFESLEEVAKLYAFGAKKYSPNNWRHNNGLGYLRCFNAMFRHLVAWINGSDVDRETGVHPLASVAFYCLAVIYYEKTGRKTDDRFRS